jgi:RHS repeat-associated protein
MNPFRTSQKIQAIRPQNPYFSNLSCGVCLQNTSDYSPFGVSLDGRTMEGDFYRRGYNGMEKDDEVKGKGNSYTTEFRQQDPRLGRWLSVDPVYQPWQSPYCSMDNNPIKWNDVNGDITPKEEKKLARKQEKLKREFNRIAKNEKKWAEKEIRKNGGSLIERTVKIDENDNTESYFVGRDLGVVINRKLSKERSNSISQYQKNTNKIEGFWYNKGEIMGMSISIGYDAYFGGGISGSIDYISIGGEDVIGGTFGGGIGFGGGVGVDAGYIKCTSSGRYRARDIQNGIGWEFSAGAGPIAYSRSGDRTSSAFYWNGETNQTSSYDALGPVKKANWISVTNANGLKKLNKLKANASIKYEWNQSNVWINF